METARAFRYAHVDCDVVVWDDDPVFAPEDPLIARHHPPVDKVRHMAYPLCAATIGELLTKQPIVRRLTIFCGFRRQTWI